MTETFEEMLAAWVRAMQASNCARRTVTQRRAFAERACRDWSDPRTWTRDDVEQYLSSNLAWSAATRITYYQHSLALFGWLEDSERIPRSPMRRMRRPLAPRGVPRPIDTDLLERGIATAKGNLRAWLLLAAYQGLRLSEIAAFRGEQIGAHELRVTGKGGAVASLPLHPRVAQLAQAYPKVGWWFPSRAGSARPYLHDQTLLKKVRDHFAELGGDATLHSLRHWFGTEVLEASGGNLRTAQVLLRHSSVVTTEIYTRVRDANRTAAILALPDLVGGDR